MTVKNGTRAGVSSSFWNGTVMQPVEVNPRLYLGDAKAALSCECHQRHGFMLVVNCTTNIPFIDGVENATHVRVPVEDNGNVEEIEKLEQKLPEIVNVIDKHLTQGHKVLVHCHMGRQRSAAVVAAYLMYKHSWTPDEAISYLRSKKPDAFFPAPNFVSALRRSSPLAYRTVG
jgi:predicted protein tyrosine phosphatase